MDIPNFDDNIGLEGAPFLKADKKDTPIDTGSIEQKLHSSFNAVLKDKKEKKKASDSGVATTKSNTNNPFQPKGISDYKEQLYLPTGKSKISDLLKIALEPDGVPSN